MGQRRGFGRSERSPDVRSADGLKWSEPAPWTCDDDEPLVVSTTQQHWLSHSEQLYLVYTRKTEHNEKVFRWPPPSDW